MELKDFISACIISVYEGEDYFRKHIKVEKRIDNIKIDFDIPVETKVNIHGSKILISDWENASRIKFYVLI
jgi:hypothetical protein